MGFRLFDFIRRWTPSAAKGLGLERVFHAAPGAPGVTTAGDNFFNITEATSDQDFRDAGEMLLGFLNWNRKRLADDWPVEALDLHEGIRGDVYSLQSRALNDGWVVFVARMGTELAGCFAIRRDGETSCELKRLFVVPHLQRTGLGRMLVEFAIEAARKRGFLVMRLDTADLQAEAIGLFTKLGFRPSPPHRNYSPGILERVVFMQKQLV